MKVIVLGAGIVGVTTAWTLAQAGHQVTIIDRQTKAADETSKGNACLISPGHTQVWNNPAAPFLHLQSLFQKDPISRVKFLNNPGFLRWAIRFLKSCGGDTSKQNTLLGLQLAIRSAKLTREIITQHSFDVSMSGKGALYWFDDHKNQLHEQEQCEFLNTAGINAQVLNANELLEREPALQQCERTLLGALHVPDDLSANCPEFARQLLALAIKQGNVSFLNEHNIQSIEHDNQKINSVETSQGRLDADLYVLALGPESGKLAKTLNLTLPIAPAKGYSLTVATNPDLPMPLHAGIDLNLDVAMTPLSRQLRITSYGQFVGFDRSWKPTNFVRHQKAANSTYPGLALWNEECNEWAGLRPMTPDGIPVIGRAKPYNNLWLNTGHGYLGWTQAMASAEMLLQKINNAPLNEFSQSFEQRW